MMVNPDSLVRLLNLERDLAAQEDHMGPSRSALIRRLTSTTWSLATLAALAAALGAGVKWQ